MIKFGLLLALLAAASMAPPQDSLNYEWESFKQKHEKSYISAEEEAKRKVIFEQNLELVIEHNKKYSEGNVTYKLAMNRFGDKLPSELTPEVTLSAEKRAYLEALLSSKIPLNITHLPNEVDRSNQGEVADFPDLWPCLSPHTFCEISNRTFNLTRKRVHVQPPSHRRTYSKMELEEILIHQSRGPVCVGMNSRLSEFMFYSRGLYNDPSCSKDPIAMDHAVVLVGNGVTEEGGQYWKIRNSWGEDWGEDGYFRASADFANECVLCPSNSDLSLVEPLTSS